jgi:hypothetical protein
VWVVRQLITRSTPCRYKNQEIAKPGGATITSRQVMIRLVAILVTLFLVIPAKADVSLWPRPVPGWTVIQVYGVIKLDDLTTFQSYTENVDPDATLVVVT